ncbi:hypothetical protein LTR97_005523 [Elasticomyces elasticus]|uniref:SprT-like domain-containing protein n=1 Tax=Elasticomyces elasticus TaxID=574655 RepID=A0AAN7W654_9PEZI|nr:hypothetical protein LTR97_005523 [Elasticomyces elasticus]
MDQWREWWQGGRSVAARKLRTSKLRTAIPNPGLFFAEPVQIFSQLFFLGAIRPYVNVQWGHDWSRLYGVMSYWDATIRINPQRPLHKSSPEAILCTLLHEMLHFFLVAYSCPGSRRDGCCDANICAFLNGGAASHGRAWMHMAKSIEDEMPRLLGFTGRLGRQECAISEIRKFGFRPSACDLRSAAYYDIEVAVRIHLRTSYDDLETVVRSRGRSVLPQTTGKRARRRRTIGICEKLVVV